MRKKLPVGIENFEEFSKENFYYVDKTMFITELLQNWGKVNLFTRPRRFGKTLNMSMLKCFFEIGTDKSLFDGLKIAENKELCAEYQGQFPVIFISLKSVDGLTFASAAAALRTVIGREASRFQFLRNSDKLSKEDREGYESLIHVDKGLYDMEDELLAGSLKNLSQLLAKHYGRQVVLLIDEYDVPLDKAFQAGYYDEMVSLIRNLFGNALKTNDNLQFAVLTGCLRISKESIFTGLNNLKVHTIADPRYEEYFGFTDEDVDEMLAFYGLTSHKQVMQDWYDGYTFGKVSVYCPWDVINYCDLLRADPEAEPENYWANTSGNGIIRRLLKKADQTTRDEVEQLINGETIVKTVRQELTYRDIEDSIDNIWSVLGEGLVPGGDPGRYLPHQPLLCGLPQGGCGHHPGYAARLPVGFHQRAGYGGTEQHERELLPRDVVGFVAKPGKLDRPIQCGDGHRVQRYFGSHAGTAGDGHRAEICRGRQSGSRLRQSSGSD